MASEKATGLVLRVIDFSETSCIVTLFTREFGKIQGLAKGGRRLKGPFESALDLLSLVRLVFLRKSSDALDLLTEAKLERRFRGRGRDLASIYAGYYLAELLSELTHDYDPHPELFDLANETLIALSAPGSLASRIARFEMLALELLGHMPNLEACADCGRPLEIAGRLHFSQRSGGLLCARCRPGRKNVVSVSAGVIRAMAALGDRRGEAWRRLEISRAMQGELRAVLNHYVSNLLGREPRMQRYLGMLAG